MTDGSPFFLPAAESLLLAGHHPGEHYRIDIAAPYGPVPAGGWPAIYLLDSSGCFGTCVEALRRMARRPDATGVNPAVVVGISAEDGHDVARRQRDFTSAPADQARDGTAGGAEDFLRFLEQQVIAAVGRKFPLDDSRRTLFGHSLAGYFTLWALARGGAPFSRYAAISPSIWWDRDGLFAALPALAGLDRRVLILAGEWEDTLPPWQQAAPGSDSVVARRKARAMVDTARQLALGLGSALGGSNVRFAALPEEDHASIVSAAIPRMLRLASEG